MGARALFHDSQTRRGAGMFHDSHGSLSSVDRKAPCLPRCHSWDSDPAASRQWMLLRRPRRDNHTAWTHQVSPETEEKPDVPGAPRDDGVKPIRGFADNRLESVANDAGLGE